MLCIKSLDVSSRRIISPRPNNGSVQRFFTEKICPTGFQFTKGVTYYLCRLNCYRQVEKAAKLDENLRSLLADLKCKANLNCAAMDSALPAVSMSCSQEEDVTSQRTETQRTGDDGLSPGPHKRPTCGYCTPVSKRRRIPLDESPQRLVQDHKHYY